MTMNDATEKAEAARFARAAATGAAIGLALAALLIAADPLTLIR
jgi:Mg/Co/Ni transporter MgtE